MPTPVPAVASRLAFSIGLSFLLLAATRGAAGDEPAPPPAPPKPAAPALPPLPLGVSALEFSEFFVKPVGPRGLELSDTLRGLHGKRVRILGYMVRREAAPPGTLILTPHPVQLHDFEYGLADDLPPNALHVTLPDVAQELPYTPGLLLLTGRLEIGNREEKDGRISVVRLLLDPRVDGGHALPGPVVAAPFASK
jgi:hypothetical protein